MTASALDDCDFATGRLQVGPWRAVARRSGLDIVRVIAALLTDRTTVALPESWQGNYTVGRAKAWIEERDAESSTLLVMEAASARPVGLVILAEVPLDDSMVDVRIGYVIAEALWGQGFATELLSGLIDWMRTEPSVHTMTGGVDLTNEASVAGLMENNGFHRIGDDEGTATYQLDLAPATIPSPDNSDLGLAQDVRFGAGTAQKNVNRAVGAPLEIGTSDR